MKAALMDIYNAFNEIFSDKTSPKAYHAYGKDTIVIWFFDKDPMIFTYRSRTDWILKPYVLV